MIGGTILGRIGRTVEGKAAHTYFEIRPVGRGAPRIDPKPILDGWKLLEATAIYRAAGKNALYGEDGTSIGQVLLMPKPLLEKRVLGDERIEIYPCGRQDIQSGQIDRRVLATLAVLAERGFRATVTSLKCGHGFYTSSGNVSHHSSGNAVDIAMINGIPILGHQEPGGITDQTINVLLQLQGTLAAGPDHLADREGRAHVRDGRPRRPHPRRLPAALRHEQEAGHPGARGAEARSVGRPDRATARDRQPDGADRDLEVRDPGQEAPQQRRAPRRIAHFPFVQFEFGFLLGPHDGRYLRRAGAGRRA